MRPVDVGTPTSRMGIVGSNRLVLEASRGGLLVQRKLEQHPVDVTSSFDFRRPLRGVPQDLVDISPCHLAAAAGPGKKHGTAPVLSPGVTSLDGDE